MRFGKHVRGHQGETEVGKDADKLQKANRGGVPAEFFYTQTTGHDKHRDQAEYGRKHFAGDLNTCVVGDFSG